MSVFGDDVKYNLEYRSTKDDGWYNCGVLLEHGNRLRVKFKDFDQSFNDEVFSISDFSTNDELGTFLLRFRPESESIADNGCSRVSEGLLVCAACSGGKHLRKFDAIVEAVYCKKHSPEKCLCTCELFWQHGPEEGRTTAANLGDVYLIKSGSVDPTAVKFTKLVKKKVKGVSSEFTLIPKNPNLSKGTRSGNIVSELQEFGSVGRAAESKRVFRELNDQGRDLECQKETSSHHYLILENLETYLCPLFMTDFIHEHTLVTAQVCIVPNLLLETYARAAIVVDDRIKLERIYEFLNNPNHFIVSSSGRPWVLAEDKLRTGTFNTNLHGFPPIYERGNRKMDLMVVGLGTEEYTKAKQQKDLYLEFRNHLNRLAQRLAMKEKNIHQGPAH